MEHQDWEQYIVHCKNTPKDKNGKEVKRDKDNSKSNILDKKVEKGELKHKKIDKSLSQQIQRARLSKGLTQKDLAKQLSIQPNIINDIECGRAIYNGQQISKIKGNLESNNKLNDKIK